LSFEVAHEGGVEAANATTFPVPRAADLDFESGSLLLGESKSVTLRSALDGLPRDRAGDGKRAS
jgi:hypothetical protein